jgi:hypothetical protein
MHGPSLTPQEAVATVARRVRRLETQGLDRDLAIQLAAVEFGLEPHKVRWCTATAFHDAAETALEASTVRVPPSTRHRGCPGFGDRIAVSRPDNQRASA